jgi:hypothetical protein
MGELIVFFVILAVFLIPGIIAISLKGGSTQTKAFPRIASCGHYQSPSVKKYPLF